MTIGIAAHGPRAGAAVLAGWRAAERLGHGEIGGFAVFAAIPEGAGPVTVECQQGGLATIRVDWAGSGLLDLMAGAPVAAVITSGPDRLIPLVQFLAAGRAGLVTGHRLPNLPGADGVLLNTATLRLIAEGVAPDEAVSRVTKDNPTLDAGLIAVTATAIGLAETAFVQQRHDRGQALIEREGVGLALLHNSIAPVAGFAHDVAHAAFEGFSRNPWT